MNKFSDEQIADRLHRAASQITPDQGDQIWDKPVVRATGSEWYLDNTTSKRSGASRMLKTLSALAACFFIFVVSVVVLNFRTNASIYLDVNPSVELRINYFDRVISANASNRDGAVILENMNLKNTDLDVALNAILGSMVKHGYLSEASGTILISVECASQDRADKLQLQVSNHVEEDMQTLINSGTVLSQQVESNDTLDDLAKKFDITHGKAALLQELVAKHPELKYEDLAKLSMSDLVEFLEEEKIDISEHIERHDNTASAANDDDDDDNDDADDDDDDDHDSDDADDDD